MDKIIYKTVTINDNMMLIIQTLIDKQAEIINGYNEIIDRLERVGHFLATHQHINGKCDIIEQYSDKDK